MEHFRGFVGGCVLGSVIILASVGGCGTHETALSVGKAGTGGISSAGGVSGAAGGQGGAGSTGGA
ncbi:MAG: hypothetical protein JWM82_4498, partial [Myxococcales bacterium]|nr:hypothetical protein [Myxococcales bacterium]